MTIIRVEKERSSRVIRHQSALLDLAKTESPDWESGCKKITEVDAKTLGVERVSIWLYNEDRSAIICKNLYKLSETSHERGLKLEAKNFPRYFKALEESRTLAAHDAQSDPRTSEFRESYLIPLGVTSMMDVPIRVHGTVIGVVCHEHTGPRREWTLEEQEFAGSIADRTSLAFEASQRKKTEEDLAHSNRQLEQFAYITSHDLQEPLHTVIGFADRVKARCAPLLGEEGRDYLDRIQGAARRMNRLIEDLLVYSRVTTAVRALEAVDLEKVVKDVIANLEGRLRETKGKIEVENLPQIWGDKMQIQQLFQNLMANALKFCKREEPPVVKILNRGIQDGLVEIAVGDNGIGFEEKYLGKIFEPFQRLHGWSEYDGSGLGLAICQKIVEQHQGRIFAKSEPGKGSTFSVRLPPISKKDLEHP